MEKHQKNFLNAIQSYEDLKNFDEIESSTKEIIEILSKQKKEIRLENASVLIGSSFVLLNSFLPPIYYVHSKNFLTNISFLSKDEKLKPHKDSPKKNPSPRRNEKISVKQENKSIFLGFVNIENKLEIFWKKP